MRTIKILSCNIRDARAHDGDNDWAHRKSACIEILRRQQADLLCFQEMRLNQQTDLLAALPDYGCYGLPEDSDTPDTPNAIFFRHSTFTLVDQQGYWLSDTPEVAGSRSWGSAYTRLANRLILQDKQSHHYIEITNTHLEDDNPLAATEQTRVILRNTPVQDTCVVQILAGDMNSDENSNALKMLKNDGWQDTYTLLHAAETAGRTYHAFQGDTCTIEPTGKIDWILTRGVTRVMAAEIIRDRMELHFPSDHYFVSATLCFE